MKKYVIPLDFDCLKKTGSFQENKTTTQAIYDFINLLFHTKAGEWPFDRDFGINYDLLDQAGSDTNNFDPLQAEMEKKIIKYETRLKKVTKAEIKKDSHSSVNILIEGKIKEKIIAEQDFAYSCVIRFIDNKKKE